MGSAWEARLPGRRRGAAGRAGARAGAARRWVGWERRQPRPQPGPASPRSPGFLRPPRPSPRPAFISPMPGCNPSFYFLVAPLRDRAQCWESASVSALKLSRSMSRELSQFCLSVSLFQEGKHSRERERERANERGRAAGGGGRGRRPRVGGESGRPAGLRPGSPRRRAVTCRPRRRARPGSHAPAAPRAHSAGRPARPARSQDPPGRLPGEMLEETS